MNIDRDITEFREAFNLPVNEKPTLINEDEFNLHWNLIREEISEMVAAYYAGDIVEVYDGIIDTMYVLGGLSKHMGLPVGEGWREVHASNCSKLDENGEPVYREDGKVLKGENYFPPRLDVLLEMASRANEVEWLDQGVEVERP